MTSKEVAQAVKKYGSIRAASRVIGVPYSTMHSWLNGTNGKRVRRVVTEQDLLVQTDVETRYATRLREVLRSLKRGEYMRDYDVRREACATGDLAMWRAVRESPEFVDCVMEVGRGSDPVIYWGHKESVASMIQRGKARRPVWAMGKK